MPVLPHASALPQRAAFLGLLVNSCVATTISAVLTSEERPPPSLIVGAIFFFSQAVGCVLGGRHCDLVGRKKGLHHAYLLTCAGLFFLVLVSWDWLSMFSVRPMRLDWSKGPWAFSPDAPTVVAPHLEGAAQNVFQAVVVHDSPLPPSHRIPRVIAFTAVTGLGSGALSVGSILLSAESAPAVERRHWLGGLSVMIGLGSVFVRAVMVLVDRQALASWVICLYATLLLALAGLWSMKFVEEPAIFRNQVIGASITPSPTPGTEIAELGAPLLAVRNLRPSRAYTKYTVLWRKYLLSLRWEVLGCCLPFLLSQTVVFGASVFHFLLISRVRGFETERQENLFALIVVTVCFAGYLATAWAMTRAAPKLLQITGFTLQAFVFFGLALCLYSIANSPIPPPKISDLAGASLLYDVTFRGFLAISSATTAIIPVEAFPTVVRGAFLGLSHGCGQLGSLFGIYMIWRFMESAKSRTALLLCCSLASMLNAALTRCCTPHVRNGQADLAQLDVHFISRLPVPAPAHYPTAAASARNTIANFI